MFTMNLRASAPFRTIAILLSISFVVAFVMPAAGYGQQAEETIYQKWEEIASLRAKGEFAQAIEILNAMITDYANSKEILKRAYNNLVFTYFKMGDEENAVAKSREALEQFPDISADIIEFPPIVQNTYDQLRSEMYGFVTIRKPEEGRAFLNEDFVGETPLQLNLVRVGQYTLTVTKSGFHDYSEIIQVDPSGKHNFEISMDRQRDKKWWLYRIGPVALAGALITYFAVSAGGDETPAPEPLPEPPAPPTN